MVMWNQTSTPWRDIKMYKWSQIKNCLGKEMFRGILIGLMVILGLMALFYSVSALDWVHRLYFATCGTFLGWLWILSGKKK